ncbi:MAG: hypothetical protein AAF909_01790, partial [Pseudomonadota bacterium]
QELARRYLFPELQIIITREGNWFPSWCHLWRELDLRHSPEMLTEADLFFPHERVAVFCDGSHHLKKKQREKDERINDALNELSIRSVRVPGRMINRDLNAAADLVTSALK